MFHWVSPNDKLATYAIDDPVVDGVACHFTVPERGGFKGWIGVAEEVSDISLACRQVGPIKIKAKFEQGDDVFRRRRSLLFKKMQIVRGCDVKRNVLVYMVYSDRIIEGSPKNSTSTVPIMPWGGDVPRCAKCADLCVREVRRRGCTELARALDRDEALATADAGVAAAGRHRAGDLVALDAAERTRLREGLRLAIGWWRPPRRSARHWRGTGRCRSRPGCSG